MRLEERKKGKRRDESYRARRSDRRRDQRPRPVTRRRRWPRHIRPCHVTENRLSLAHRSISASLSRPDRDKCLPTPRPASLSCYDSGPYVFHSYLYRCKTFSRETNEAKIRRHFRSKLEIENRHFGITYVIKENLEEVSKPAILRKTRDRRSAQSPQDVHIGGFCSNENCSKPA